MACYYPLSGWRSRSVEPSGKRKIVFKPNLGYLDMPVKLPCGRCVGCRLERSRQWAIRCMHEAQMHDKNCFITLTFNNEHLPEDKSLDVRHFQLFMKRLRKKFGSNIRFFHCGEYGAKNARPHYHAIIFGFDFPDRVYYTTTGSKFPIDRSPSLEALWPFGYSTVGNVTFESAAYVARYIMKKVTGDGAEAHYGDRKPEYTTMSRRAGIGKAWYDQYKSDVFPRDELVLRGVKMRPPKYYDGLFEVEDPDAFAKIKGRRKLASLKYKEENQPDRLKVKETIKLRQVGQLLRTLDDDY